MKFLSAMVPLKNTVTIRLHTVNAVRLWSGMTSDLSGQHNFNGMQYCMAKLRYILRAAEQDDPWADYWLWKIEQKQLTAREQLTSLRQKNDERLNTLPDSLSTEQCHNTSPALFTLSSTLISPPGMSVLYLLLDFDMLVCDVVQAHQFALLSGGEKRNILWQGSHLIRSIYSLAQEFYTIGASRLDVTNGTSVAKAAEKRLGRLPPDVISGKQRSQWSPHTPPHQERK